MNRVGQASKVRTEVWVAPGREQTLQELEQMFAGRIVTVDRDRGEILVAVIEEVLS